MLMGGMVKMGGVVKVVGMVKMVGMVSMVGLSVGVRNLARQQVGV
jgi:hypothetical protein